MSRLVSSEERLLEREIARNQVRKPSDILGFAAITEQEVTSLLGVPP
jgi:hypothetical protein